MTKKLSIGLVGTGRIGRVHAKTIQQHIGEAELLAVTDVNLESAQECAVLYGIPYVAPHFEALLADDAIQAVAICSSTDTHAQYIIEAAHAGKHIFCEKPIDPSLRRIDEALHAVEKAGVKLMIGFNRRFDPNHQRIKHAIESGEIGQPEQLTIISRDPSPPPISYVKVSGGIFTDMTIHDFDMARFLFGEVDEVYTAAAVRVDPAIGEADDVDTTIITLKFASGALGVIQNSRRAVYGYDQRVEAFGSLGAASSENWYPNAVTISRAQGIRRDLPLNFFMDRYLVSYQVELAAFVDCVLKDLPSPVSGADGRTPVVIAKAATRSLKENRPVRLAEITD